MDPRNLPLHPDSIRTEEEEGNETTTVVLPFGEFADDLEHNLGRANGNCYQRKPGIPNVHDGQIMVRLKKKRFIVIDYSIVPTPADIACAAATPYVKTPPGAGTQKCTSANCSKIGVPVCLFDSDPDEPISLYLRSGLCFTCQRNLNEKRRTQRKRKGEHGEEEAHNKQRFRLNDQILDLDPDAIIINGQLDGTQHHGPGYEYPEILLDLQKISEDAVHEIQLLVSAVSTQATPPLHDSPEHLQIEQIYDKTFQSFTKGLFLLSQFKSSIDTAIMENSLVVDRTVVGGVQEGSSMSDVVASAAAVAAAQAANGPRERMSLATGIDEDNIIEAEDSGSVGDPLPLVDDHVPSVSV